MTGSAAVANTPFIRSVRPEKTKEQRVSQQRPKRNRRGPSSHLIAPAGCLLLAAAMFGCSGGGGAEDCDDRWVVQGGGGAGTNDEFVDCPEPDAAVARCMSEEEACGGDTCGLVWDEACAESIDCGACDGSCDEVDLECGPGGECVDDDGVATCECEPNYVEPWCEECEDGYYEEDGECIPDCSVVDPTCSGHGECVDQGDYSMCECDEGYTGYLCEDCDEGYQDNDGDGVCEVACDNEEIDVCLETQVCDDSSGIAECSCPSEGFKTDRCEECATGYTPVDDICVYAPASCEEVLAIDPSTTDGDQTLYYENDPDQPWDAHCIDMETDTPRDFLNLDRTTPDRNFSSYRQLLSGAFSRTTTHYRRLAIDPYTLVVQIGDQSFSTTTSEGNPQVDGEEVTHMAYASAMACLVSATAGNVDLRDTAFQVAPEQAFCGSSAAQNAEFSDDRRVVNLEISSTLECQWLTVDPCPDSEPINDHEGELQLNYIGTGAP